MNQNDLNARINQVFQQSDQYAREAREALVARELEVPEQLGDLLRNVNAVRESMEALDNRLAGSILRPRAPEPAGNVQGGAPTPMTPIASQIQDANIVLRQLSDRMQSVLQRLEA